MGEYAEFKGQRTKIGTCEDMYYLRFDQRFLVGGLEGNVNPRLDKDAELLRFRFPWPDEDDVEPGAFEDFYRSLAVNGLEPDPHAGHNTVQFSARPGYVVSLPCPESHTWPAHLKVHRNGFAGSVVLVAQRWLLGKLWPVLRCGGCGSMWREMELPRVEELALRIRCEGDKRAREGGDGGFYQAVADRVLAGAGGAL